MTFIRTSIYRDARTRTHINSALRDTLINLSLLFGSLCMVERRPIRRSIDFHKHLSEQTLAQVCWRRDHKAENKAASFYSRGVYLAVCGITQWQIMLRRSLRINQRRHCSQRNVPCCEELNEYTNLESEAAVQLFTR
jgi:hypothetical protein